MTRPVNSEQLADVNKMDFLNPSRIPAIFAVACNAEYFGNEGDAAAYPHKMDVKTAYMIARLGILCTNNALAAAEEVLFSEWERVAKLAREAAGRKGVRALRERAEDMRGRYRRVHHYRQDRLNCYCPGPVFGGEVELNPAGYRILAELYLGSKLGIGDARGVDAAAMRLAAAGASV